MAELDKEAIETVCQNISEHSMGLEDACNLEGVDVQKFRELADSDGPVAQKVKKAKAQAILYWQKQLKKPNLSSGEQKSAHNQLKALDPRYRRKTSDDDSLHIEVLTVGPEYLPTMPFASISDNEGG